MRMQILSLKASCSKPLTSPQSALLRVSSPKPFLKAPSFKAPCSKRPPQSLLLQSPSLKAPPSKPFLCSSFSSKRLLQSLFLKASPQSLFFQSLLLKASPSKPSLSKLLLQSSLPQSFLFKASRFSSKRSPQSLLPKVYPQSSFLKALSSKPSPQSAPSKALSLKASHSKPPPSPQSFFCQSLFFFKAFSFKAFCSKRFLQRILKDIKGSRNQTSCCETLTRRNLSATKSATYVHLVFPKILGAAVWREALLDNPPPPGLVCKPSSRVYIL